MVVANVVWKFNIQKMSSFKYFVWKSAVWIYRNNSQSKITQCHNSDNTIKGTKYGAADYYFGRDIVVTGKVKKQHFVWSRQDMYEELCQLFDPQLWLQIREMS